MITLISLSLEDYIKEVKKNFEVLAYREINRVYSYGFLSEISPEYPTFSYNAMFMEGAISLQQPIRISQPLRALSYLELRRAKKYESTDLENILVLSAVEAYLDAAVLREKERVLKEILDNLERAREISGHFYKTGALRFSEVKVLEVKMDVIRARMEMVLGNLKKVEEMVKFYYGGEPGEIFLPEVETLPRLDSLIDLLEKSPSLKRREHLKKSKMYNTFSKMLPLTLSPGILYHNGDLYFSISFSVPVWVLRYWGEISSSRAEYKVEEYMYKAEREKKIAQLKGLYGNYLSSLETLESLENSLKKMENILELEEENYKTGKLGLYELLILYNEVLDLKIKVVEAKAEVIRKVYEVKGLVGTL